MTERITDLWILESTEVKFWISTLQKSNNLLIELSEVCWFNQNFYYFCWICKTVPDIMVFFSRNHESGQIGGVDSEKHYREKRPNTGHEPAKFRKVWWDLSRSWGLFRFSPGCQAPGTVHLKEKNVKLKLFNFVLLAGGWFFDLRLSVALVTHDISCQLSRLQKRHYLDWGLEEHSPDQPVSAEQRELVARVASQRLLLTVYLKRIKKIAKINS